MKVSILSIIFFITVATPIMAAMNCGTPSPGTSYCQSCGVSSTSPHQPYSPSQPNSNLSLPCSSFCSATAAVTTKSTVTRTPPATPPVEVPKLGAWLIVPAKPVLLSLSDS
ncbi:hypothetical protein A4X06_0g3851 [Tilletia controversa]|uniref:Secreted protein n=1 Tax=Tilletia controversa TaxID=13291 RepID=A0A8X7SXS6_9BASI|nr:hypothetical protein A4X06_0g3851 [Tilletia controversa]